MLIKQTVKKNYRSMDLVVSIGDADFIIALMEGIVDTYKESGSGGTDVVTPAVLRGMKFGVSRKADSLSATASIKHVKPSKHANDVFGHVALFDADFNSALSATKINLIYQGAQA